MKKLLRIVTKSFIFLFLALTLCGTIAVACSKSPSKPVKPEKPAKIMTKHCKPLKSSWGRRGSKGKVNPLSDPCYVLYNLGQIIEGEEGKEIEEVLPELLSLELTQNFSQEEFEQAIIEAKETFGEIASFNFPNEFTVQGDWAQAELEITTTIGQQLKYLVIFHKEGNSWKIFGTEEVQL